jgi:hypothetical protein
MRLSDQVGIGEDGLLEGCEGPDASPEVAALLRAAVGGHELGEEEMVALLGARGADFQVRPCVGLRGRSS